MRITQCLWDGRSYATHVIPASFQAVAAYAATLSCFDRAKLKLLIAFSEDFSDSLGMQPMKVRPMNIYLRDNAIPHRILGPCPLPLCFEEAAQTEIDNNLHLSQQTGVVLEFFYPEGTANAFVS